MTDSEESVPDVDAGVASVEVRNVGGIDHSTLDIEPGGTVLTGRNATNRTSLLSAIGGVLGGRTATLKSDAEEGQVTLEIGDGRYQRTYTRSAGGVRVEGSPYTDDGTYVDTFVALLEDNPARQAVERGDDIREVFMRPVDTDAIEAQIDELRQELREHEAEADRVEGRRAELPDLVEQRRELEAEVESLEDQLASLRETVAEFEADAEEADGETELVDELERRRQTAKEQEEALEVARAELDALEADVVEIEEALASTDDVESAEIESVESDLADVRASERSIEETIAALATVVEFNEEFLADGSPLPGVSEAGDVTAGLAPDGEREVVCWTCGSQVKRAAIGDRLEDLSDHAGELRAERANLREEIEDLEDRRREIVETVERRESLSARRTSTLEKIDGRRERVRELEATVESLREETVELEAAVADAGAAPENDVLPTYERISDLEYERGQRRRELDAVQSQIDTIEALPGTEALAERRDEIRKELARNRSRIDELEATAVSAFNEHMDELLTLLEYGNVGRVWIERKTATEGGESTFDLHVVRESDDAGYEDVVENLSESEREVIGLVVALAGYLVHEVHETVPFVLLDSLEAIDAERIATLVDYFIDFAPYLVVALLPEDAAAVDASHAQLTTETLT